jgi:hypothetical protein
MKLAIMQPYFFPYIGYFQLMNAVDKFVIYDDVTFIKKGWINRNNILVNGEKYLFTIPIKNASQNTLIKDLELSINNKWITKFLKTVNHAYKNAPFFEFVFPIFETIVKTKTKYIKNWHIMSYELIKQYLGINTIIVESSSIYGNQILKGQSRILDICTQEKTSVYLNPIGGEELYDRALFLKNRIQINFLKGDAINYKQFNNEFVPGLSIIDLMMFNDKQQIQELLNQYKLK